MAIEDIDLGTIPLDGTDGDTAREAFTKVNGNFEDLDTRVTALENEPSAGTVSSVNGILPNSSGNVSLTAADVGAATTAQGLLADSAVQPGSLGTAAYLDANDFATNEQGALADTAVQPAELEDYERVLIAGDGITIDRSNPDNPVISSAGGTGIGTVTSVAGVSPSPDGNVPQTDLVTALGINNKVDKVEGKQLSTEDYTNQEKLKLAAIAPQATQNQTDAYLLSRANHTGTQTASTISDFASTVRSTLLTGLSAGTNAVIAATDTLLQALAKLQGQIAVKLTNPMTAAGDIIVGGSSGAPQRLPIGSVGQAIRVGSSGASLEYFDIPGSATRIGYTGSASTIALGIIPADATKVTIIIESLIYPTGANLLLDIDDGSGNWLAGTTEGTTNVWTASATAGSRWSSVANLFYSGILAGTYSGKIELEKTVGNLWLLTARFGSMTAIYGVQSVGKLPGTQVAARNIRLISNGSPSIIATVKVEK